MEYLKIHIQMIIILMNVAKNVVRNIQMNLMKKNKWCRKCQVGLYFLSWSGDERIDNFLQELQYKIDDPNNN
jgi:hypothetical protein